MEIDYSNAVISGAEKKQNVRNEIHKKAGDTESLLGTTADATQLLLLAFSQLIVKLNTAQNIEDVRAAAEPFDGLASGFLERQESGAVTLPVALKGLDKVIGDIEHQATEVSKVLTEAAKG